MAGSTVGSWLDALWPGLSYALAIAVLLALLCVWYVPPLVQWVRRRGNTGAGLALRQDKPHESVTRSGDFYIILIGSILVSNPAANAIRGKIAADFPTQQAFINATITLVSLLVLAVAFAVIRIRQNRRLHE